LDILIVDDEADIRDLISDVFQDEGYQTRTARNSVTAFEAFAQKVPDAVVLDIWLKDSALDGLGILETVKRKYPEVPVVMISGHGNIETAISAIRIGAYDYLEKPFKEDRLLHIVRRAIESAKLQSENSELRLRTSEPNVMIGNSPAILGLRQAVEKVAPTGSRVFITGQAGAGKEVIARMVHDKSARSKGAFVTLNAASLSSDMMDHELFGTEDNTDLNAPPRKIGVFERADGGTLFIDEIADIPQATQGKFVRFLQDKEFNRIGGDASISADVRVIASTHLDPQEEIKNGRLREDLYYRLNVVPLEAPALKERREDIPLLCDYFLAHAAESSKLPARRMSDDAVAAMQAYDWPGNIRQLRNVIEWMLIMCPGSTANQITSTMLPSEIFSLTPAVMTPEVNTDIMSMKLRQAREVFEKQYLMAQISRFGGNISRTATFIGMERSALHRKLKSLNVGTEEPIDA
jgi:two-component system nitrogen regulation response regulator NtrX